MAPPTKVLVHVDEIPKEGLSEGGVDEAFLLSACSRSPIEHSSNLEICRITHRIFLGTGKDMLRVSWETLTNKVFKNNNIANVTCFTKSLGTKKSCLNVSTLGLALVESPALPPSATKQPQPLHPMIRRSTVKMTRFSP